MTKQDLEPAKSGLDPFQALVRLSHVITAIDHLLEPKTGSREVLPLQHRLVYARNTLVVALQLWQSDLLTRLGQSRGSFYVYCMLDSERLAFLRRMHPALEFTAGEMRALHLAALDHVIPLVDQAAEDAVFYAIENRRCIIMAKEAFAPGSFPDLIEHKALPLPPREGIDANSGRARTG